MHPRALSTNGLPRFAAVCVLALCIVGTTIAGIQGSGRRLAAFGAITSTGDITVNGTTYESAHAHVSVNGHASDRSHLHVGDVVTIDGSIDAGGTSAIADQISYVADLRGVITSMQAEAQTFSVLGRTVRTSSETIAEGESGAGIAVGQIVEVSGYPNAAGELVAARVTVQSQESSAQMRGTVAALDQHAHTFLLGALLVDYEAASVTGALRNGATVVATGDSADGAQMLVAERVDMIAPLGASGEKGDVAGIITSFSSAADFELSGQRISGDEKTKYVLRGGALGPDTIVHVKGRFRADGALLADKVERVNLETGKKAKKVKG